MSAYKRWAEPDERGIIRRTLLAPPTTKLEAPWIELSPKIQTAVTAWKNRFRIVDGEIVARRALRLSVSILQIKADGQDKCEVMLIPDQNLPGDEKIDVEVLVNGKSSEIRLATGVLELYSSSEGTFKVELVDPRFYSEPSSWNITALNLTEENA